MQMYKVPMSRDVIFEMGGGYSSSFTYYWVKIKLTTKDGRVNEKYKIDNPDFDTIKRKAEMIVNDILSSSYNPGKSSNIILKVLENILEQMREEFKASKEGKAKAEKEDKAKATK